MFNKFKKSILPIILCVGIAAAPITANAAIYGDANSDGTLTATDSAYVLSYVLDPANTDISPQAVDYLDVTGDGMITAQDAAAILTKVLDYSYKFPAIDDDITSGSGGDVNTSGSGMDTTVQTTVESTVHTTEASTQTTEAFTETTTHKTETSTEVTTGDEIPDSGIKTDSGIFVLGQAESTLPKAYSTGIAPDGLTWYSYSDDYAHYTKVGVENGSVVSIVTYDTDAAYDSVSIGSSIDTSSGNNDPYMNIITHKTTRDAIIEFYYDSNDSNRLYSIVLTSPSYLSTQNNYTANTVSELQKQITDMTNAYRAQYGLSPYAWNYTLAKVSQAHAEDMAENSYFSHKSLNGDTLGTRIENSGLNYASCGENIDCGYYTAEGALNGWINSSGHRANLLATKFTHIGVGTAYNPGDEMGYGTRFVQDFMRPAM